MAAAKAGKPENQYGYDQNRNQYHCNQYLAQAVIFTPLDERDLCVGRNGFTAMGSVLPSGSDRILTICALGFKGGASLRTGGVFLQNWRLAVGTLVTIEI